VTVPRARSAPFTSGAITPEGLARLVDGIDARRTRLRAAHLRARLEPRASLDWHATRVHDPFHDPAGADAVLNACRALCFSATGRLVSKSAGARWLPGRRFARTVREALEWRDGRRSTPLDREAVLRFLEWARARLAGGGREAGG